MYRADFARCPVDGDALETGEVDPLIGQIVGQHYVIDAFIGEGAMARVYRAHHGLLTSKQFAVKVMLGDLAAKLEMRMRFAAEADAASKLDHPNVVTVVDFGRSDTGLLYIVMELIAGDTLLDLIGNAGPLPPRRALSLARQICQGLAHAHERGLVHRDLKPENIVVAGRPEIARIVDFGLAIPTDADRSTRLTAVGLAMGTPIYAAPEQARNDAVDHRADLFALGVTLFEMLTGHPPWEGTIAEIARYNASDRVPPIIGHDGERVAPAIEDIVRTLMRRDPAHRYQSALAVIDAIDAVQLAPSSAATLHSASLTAAATAPMPMVDIDTVSLRPRGAYLRPLVGGVLAMSVALAAHFTLRDDGGVAARANAAPSQTTRGDLVAPVHVTPPPAATEVISVERRPRAEPQRPATRPAKASTAASSSRTSRSASLRSPGKRPAPPSPAPATPPAPVADAAFHDGPMWLSDIS